MLSRIPTLLRGYRSARRDCIRFFMFFLPFGEAPQSGLQLRQCLPPLWAKQRLGCLQLRFERALQGQPLPHTLVNGHLAQQTGFVCFERIPTFAQGP